ncbi:hypothetical protein BUALT_Bualt07G0054300 [Buddleja alternifolia]|uniref:RING-type E3 ubiquitin transferase n=1 Tax=Buddleja alternifolia TaxID=168488 RepID=A0AAV6X9A8_9LAMI|nr:hypothetical protein BUALT_Bualt07G0054300 [Buddleja alternifolia]
MAFRQVNNFAPHDISGHSNPHFQPFLSQHYIPDMSSGGFWSAVHGGFQPLRQRVYAASPPLPGYFYVNHDEFSYPMFPLTQDYANIMINVTPPTYIYPSYSTPIQPENYYYNSNMATDPSSTPLTRGNDARPAVYQDDTINNHGYNAAGWIEEDEALSMALYLLGQEYYLTTDDNSGGLSEEVISKYLKTRNFDKDNGDSEICIVCQDDLCQEDATIGVLDCGHEYHATCIGKWLQEKNICPLCKATALHVDDE